MEPHHTLTVDNGIRSPGMLTFTLGTVMRVRLGSIRTLGIVTVAPRTRTPGGW